jgi:hypothetical protein
MTWKRLYPSLILMGLMIAMSAMLWPADPKPEPKITIEQQAEWLQARAELAEAQLQLKAAEARMNAVVKEIQAVCPAVINKAGRPECPVKPVEPTK